MLCFLYFSFRALTMRPVIISRVSLHELSVSIEIKYAPDRLFRALSPMTYISNMAMKVAGASSRRPPEWRRHMAGILKPFLGISVISICSTLINKISFSFRATSDEAVRRTAAQICIVGLIRS